MREYQGREHRMGKEGGLGQVCGQVTIIFNSRRGWTLREIKERPETEGKQNSVSKQRKNIMLEGRKGTPLVEQWIRICLPMQGTRVQFLVREDSTWYRAPKPVCHNYWAFMLQLLKPAHTEPVLHEKCHQMRSPRTAAESSPHSPPLEKACAQQQRPRATNIK